MTQRTVEIFSAGCPACDETVQLVRAIACPSCDVAVLDMSALHLRVAADADGANKARTRPARAPELTRNAAANAWPSPLEQCSYF